MYPGAQDIKQEVAVSETYAGVFFISDKVLVVLIIILYGACTVAFIFLMASVLNTPDNVIVFGK